ncbi:MAG: hypothetical protein VW907_07360, partial [Opitutae bacterium]
SMDLDTSSPSWELILTAANAISLSGDTVYRFPYKVMGSINVDQYLAFFACGDQPIPTEYPLYCFRTNDSRSTSPTWSVSTVSAAINTSFSAQGWRGGSDIVPHPNSFGSLTLYTVASIHTGSINRAVYCYRSIDAGATWTNVGTVIANGSTNKSGFSIHSPYNNNDDGNLLYCSAYSDTAALRSHYKSTNGGATWTNMTSGTYSQIHRWGAETYTLDSQRV